MLADAGDTVTEAKRNAYEGVARIHFQGAFFRRDIGNKALIPLEETVGREMYS